MATLSFETIRFSDQQDHIRADYLLMYTFDIPKSDLEELGPVEVKDGNLEFPDTKQSYAERKINPILAKGFLQLQNKLSKKPCVYIHRNSGIPLRGHIAFGLVDRGSNVIEVRPMTSCNIACTYCSVNEDIRPVDFVVEVDYLIEEFNKLVADKDCDDIEAHIASQGEPTLYPDLIRLIKGISAHPKVKEIVTDTNGLTLSPKKIDAMMDAGFTRYNVSLNAIDPEVGKQVAGAPYNTKHVMEMCKYIAEKYGALCISPTFIPTVNDAEMPKIIEFAKTLVNPNWKFKMGIQNFLAYKFGRNPVKQMEWDDFFALLKKWEKEHDVKLIVTEEDFNIHKSPAAPKVFTRNEIVKAEIKCKGRLPGEKIAVARGYCISLPKCRTEKGVVKVKITKTKHHLYIGQVLS